MAGAGKIRQGKLLTRSEAQLRWNRVPNLVADQPPENSGGSFRSASHATPLPGTAETKVLRMSPV